MAYTKGNHRNVIVGAAAIFISALENAANPEDVEEGLPAGRPWELPEGIAPGAGTGKAVDLLSAPGSGFRNAGYTTDGVEVSYEPDFGEVTVDQELDAVQMFKQGMSVSVNTTLSEATLENLVVAWGQDDSTLGDDEESLDITGGELHDDPVERSLAFVGKGTRNSSGAPRERIYYLRRALQVESSAHSLSRADATTIPVSFRCMPDANATDGDYGRIIQRVVS